MSANSRVLRAEKVLAPYLEGKAYQEHAVAELLTDLRLWCNLAGVDFNMADMHACTELLCARFLPEEA